MTRKEAQDALFAIHDRKRFNADHGAVTLDYQDYLILFSLAQDNTAELTR